MDRAENCGMSVSRYLNKLVDRDELDATAALPHSRFPTRTSRRCPP